MRTPYILQEERKMKIELTFFVSNILLGVGLAMDAFSLSLSNGLNEPCMKKRKMCGVAATFAFFQAFMPLTGWVCVHTIVQCFSAFGKLIPWIALALLGYIGGSMIYEGIKNEGDVCDGKGIGLWGLIIQGIATSIDALSVGFVISDYDFVSALLAALVIAAVTFVICMVGIMIGRKVGTKLAGKAGIFGGVILILIGLEIFISSWR